MQDQKNSIPTTGDNAIEDEKKKSDNKYYNYLKKAILLGKILNL